MNIGGRQFHIKIAAISRNCYFGLTINVTRIVLNVINSQVFERGKRANEIGFSIVDKNIIFCQINNKRILL
jgi:hypothetical protein